MLNERRRENLKRALNPRTVCYIGGAFLENTIQYNRRLGFDGEVWVVNPKYDTIGGAKCYPTVDDLPGAPDATFIAVNREMTNQVVKSLAARGAGGAICYAAGYSEVGGVGPALEDELRANAGDMALVGPNCYGINNFLHGVPLLAIASSGERVERGCAFIAQSGNLCINVSNNQRSAELAYVISCGNQAVLDIADFVDVLIDNPAITCFALFVEAIPDVAHFSRVALRALKAGKPIIAIKSGVSELGKKMALSHTASLAGDDSLYQALFVRLGIIRVSTPVELLETAKYITVTGVPKGRRLAVFTCSGGDSETVADLGDPLGVILPQPNAQQFKELRAVMPEFANVTNPFDYNTNFWGNYDVLVKLFHVLLRENVDAGLLIVDSPSEIRSEHKHETDAVVHATRDAGRKAGVPVAYCSVMPEASNSEMRKWSHEDGIAALQGIREGVGAVARTMAFGERRQTLLARAELDSHALPDVAPLAGEARALDEWQGKQALAACGLTVPAGRTATIDGAAAAAEAIGFPVAVKLLSDTILHKTDVGGVALNLTTPELVAAAARDMADRLGVTQVLVEPMAPKPVAEMIIGITRSEEFGPVLVIGAGGVLVELYKDAASLLLPAHEDDIRAAIDSLKIARLLDGFRGGPRGDREALVQAVKAVAAYAEANRDTLAELDVNPLFVLPEGQGAIAVDALIRKA